MLKIIRMFTFIISYLKKRTAPLIANYDLTSKCNLNCKHCYWTKSFDSKTELTQKEWIKLFTHHHNRGTRTSILTGGEPALKINLIRHAVRIFDYVSIVSNGTIRIPDDIKIRIFVSIDGPKEVHDNIRRKKVFDKVF